MMNARRFPIAKAHTCLTSAARTLLACGLVASGVAAQAHAQSPPKPSVADVSGKWLGRIEITAPGGNVEHDTALLLLKQQGASITGSIGRSEAQQSPIEAGSMEGADAHFIIRIHDGMAMTFHLHLDGDLLQGEAISETPEGKMNAKVIASRNTAAGEPPAASAAPLFNDIMHMDGIVFDAFNSRDLRTLSTCFTKDLEFYHDREGLTRYTENMHAFKRHFASPATIRRELVEGTLEVHPLQGYGAVETGTHRFFTTEPGLAERLTATSKFVFIWRRIGGEWKISRVISYDHS